MKAILGLVGGFVLTLMVFGSGLAFAAWLLTAKPVHQAKPTASVAELWTRDARPVDKAAQALERMPAMQPAEPDVASSDIPAFDMPAVNAVPDPTVTAAVADSGEKRAEPPNSHVRWCANHFRSYHADDNSYTSYGGQQRPCVSPYFDASDTQPSADDLPVADTQPEGDVSYVAAGDAAAGSDHADYCFSRYRSYRPEDNSYQPYSGGPRRQCE